MYGSASFLSSGMGGTLSGGSSSAVESMSTWQHLVTTFMNRLLIRYLVKVA